MINRLKACFSEEILNTGRQPEVDVAKGFAIVFMVLCHTFSYYSGWRNEHLRVLLYSVLGGPFSAAVFMFCMGIGICYSRKNQPIDWFRRGCRLLFIGFVLQILRGILPALIYTLDESGSLSNSFGDIFLYELSEIDILQFAGLFFIVFSLLKRMNLSILQINLLAILFSLMGQFLRFYSTDDFFSDAILGIFIRSHDESYFPFLNWFLFPIAGYTFGTLWIRCQNKKTFFQIVSPICWVITCFYLGFQFPYGGFYDEDYYYGIGLLDGMFALILVIAMLGFSYYISRHFHHITKTMCWMSKKITSIYCVHWILIPYAYMIISIGWNLDEVTVPDAMIIPLGIVFLIASCAIVGAYNKFIGHRRRA